MKGTVTESKPAPTGDYRVQVVDIEEFEGNFGPQLRFTLEVVDGPYAGKQIYAWCAAKLSTRSKLAQWAAALGCPFVPGEMFDTDDLVGRQAIAVVTLESGDNGNEFNRVQGLRSVQDPFEDQ